MYALMYMIGFVDENARPIGELEYQAMIRQEASRQELKEVCRHIAQTEEPALRTVTTCTSNVQLAKKILAVTVAADILPKAYGQVVGDSGKEDFGGDSGSRHTSKGLRSSGW
eukprot:s2953_g8.t1